MADSRLPAEWHNNPAFDDLSDTAWRVFTGALMWSNGHGTDGFIPSRYIKFLHPDGDQPPACRDLEVANLWERVDGGMQLVGWVPKLGQSTAANVEHTKKVNRARQARWRAEQAKKLGLAPAPKFEEERDVTRDETRAVTAHVGKDSDRDRDRDSRDDDEEAGWFVNAGTGEVTDTNADSAPTTSDWGTRSCQVCGKSIPTDSPVPWCASQDPAHRQYRDVAASAA